MSCFAVSVGTTVRYPNADCFVDATVTTDASKRTYSLPDNGYRMHCQTFHASTSIPAYFEANVASVRSRSVARIDGYTAEELTFAATTGRQVTAGLPEEPREQGVEQVCTGCQRIPTTMRVRISCTRVSN